MGSEMCIRDRADDVLAGEAEGDGLLLNGEGVDDALGGECVDDVLIDSEISEGCQCSECLSGDLRGSPRSRIHAVFVPQARAPLRRRGHRQPTRGGGGARKAPLVRVL